MSKICLSCGNELPDSAKFCNICGTEMQEETCAAKDPEPKPVLCKACGSPLKPDANFCKRCGAPTHAGTAPESQDAPAKPQEPVRQESPPNPQTAYAGNPQGQPQILSKPKSVDWSKIGGALSVVAALLLLIYCFAPHPISDTKQIVFEKWGTTELGEAVSQTLEDPAWEYEKIGRKRYLVTVSGFCTDLEMPLTLTFRVNYSKDHVYAKPYSGELDGEWFGDDLSIGIAMVAIYSEDW